MLFIQHHRCPWCLTGMLIIYVALYIIKTHRNINCLILAKSLFGRQVLLSFLYRWGHFRATSLHLAQDHKARGKSRLARGCLGLRASSSHAGWLSSARAKPRILEERYQIPGLLSISMSLPASPFIHQYEAIPPKLMVSVGGMCLHAA